MDASEDPVVPFSRKTKGKNSSYCCVPQCSTYSSEGIRFHHFPKNKPSREAWKVILKIGKPVTDSDRVCSQHFLPSDYLPQAKNTATRYLKKTSVPSQKLPVRQHDRVDSSSQKSLKIDRQNRAESRAARQSRERSPSPNPESDPELPNVVVVEAAEHNPVQSDPIPLPTQEKGTQSDKLSLLSLIPDAAKLYTFTVHFHRT